MIFYKNKNKMFVEAPLPRPLVARPSLPPSSGKWALTYAFSRLSTRLAASYAPSPVHNCHQCPNVLYNLCITTHRLNIMDTVEHRIELLLGLTISASAYA